MALLTLLPGKFACNLGGPFPILLVSNLKGPVLKIHIQKCTSSQMRNISAFQGEKGMDDSCCHALAKLCMLSAAGVALHAVQM